VEEAIAGLAATASLEAGDGTVTLTDTGRTRHGQVSSRLTEIRARVFDFPAEDLAAAGRILGVITERASALLTAS
jgi:predicted NAD/FAD-dependent oxidoreductase